MRRALVVGIISLLVSVVASQALGGVQGHASEALGVVAEAIPDAEFVVVIDNASAQRASPAGRSLTAMLEEFGVGTSGDVLSEALTELAESVGVEPPQAFDIVLGRRLIVVGTGPWHGGDSAWAVASVMPRRQALRVLDALHAKGRDVESGQTIFALEDGAYRAALIRPRGPRGQPDDLRLVIFGPKDSSELISLLIRSLSNRKNWGVLVGKGHEPVAAIAGQMNEAAGSLSFGIAQLDTGWKGQATLHGIPRLPATAGWSPGMIDRLTRGRWFVKAGAISFDEILGSPTAWMIPFDLKPIRLLNPWITGRVYLGIQPEGQGIAFEAGLEVTDTGGAAADFDRVMHRYIASLSGRSEDDGRGFEGFLPAAVRRHPIGGALAGDLDIFGEHPTAAWFMTTATGPGWWVLRVGEGTEDQAQAVRALGSLLPGFGDGGRLQSAGSVHPGPLGEAFERATQMPQPLLKPLEHIELFRWTTRPGRQSELEITFEVRMSVGDG